MLSKYLIPLLTTYAIASLDAVNTVLIEILDRSIQKNRMVIDES